MRCSVCRKESDCRPYGAKGAMICFPCAMEPGRKAETERQFASQLEAAEKAGGGFSAIDGEEYGVRPATPEEREAAEGSEEE